jgi:hypothetical protein
MARARYRTFTVIVQEGNSYEAARYSGWRGIAGLAHGAMCERARRTFFSASAD